MESESISAVLGLWSVVTKERSHVVVMCSMKKANQNKLGKSYNGRRKVVWFGHAPCSQRYECEQRKHSKTI
jgi:hypothetical protein